MKLKRQSAKVVRPSEKELEKLINILGIAKLEIGDNEGDNNEEILILKL